MVFQEVFGKQKNSRLTGHLISLIIGREINNVDLDANKMMLGNRKNAKTGRLDIRAKFNNGEDCNIELHILEIPKIKENEILKDELAQWLKFIENPGNKEVEKFMSENKYLKQAKEELAYLSGEPGFQRLVEARAGFLKDQKTFEVCGEKRGKKEGQKEE